MTEQKQDLSKEEQLKQKSEKLKMQLAKNNKKLADIMAKKNLAERKKRNHELICSGAISEMVNPKFINVEHDTTMYKLYLGAMLQLDELIKANDENAKQKLAILEQKATIFLNNRKI